MGCLSSQLPLQQPLSSVHLSFEVHRTCPETFSCFCFPTSWQEFQPRKMICSFPQSPQCFTSCTLRTTLLSRRTSLKLELFSQREVEVRNWRKQTKPKAKIPFQMVTIVTHQCICGGCEIRTVTDITVQTRQTSIWDDSVTIDTDLQLGDR